MHWDCGAISQLDIMNTLSYLTTSVAADLFELK
jgi:hypothetical protein